jgi:hypothetical protein
VNLAENTAGRSQANAMTHLALMGTAASDSLILMLRRD